MLVILGIAPTVALRWPSLVRLFRDEGVASCTINLLKGDIADIAADALITSAHPYLEGPTLEQLANRWSFEGQVNADSAIRFAGGPALATATMKLAAAAEAPLDVGSAHVTPAGELKARVVVHCIAPIAEEYSFEDGKALLEDTIMAGIRAAEEAGARSLALPAVGCGVAGFAPEVGAKCILDALGKWLDDSSDGVSERRLRRVDLVVFEDEVMKCWRSRMLDALGEPAEIQLRSDDDFGVYRWAIRRGRRGEDEEADARAEAEQAIFGGGRFVPGFGTLSALDD